MKKTAEWGDKRLRKGSPSLDKWPERESSVQLKRSLKRTMPFKTDIKEKKRINC